MPADNSQIQGSPGLRGALKSRAGRIVAGVSAFVLLAVGVMLMRDGAAAGDDGSEGPSLPSDAVQWRVKRDNLLLSILAPAELQTQVTTNVTNEVQRTVKITWIVEEGTRVSKGDRLVELDAADLEEQLLRQRIRMADVTQSLLKAKDDKAIAESKARTDLLRAENNVDIARLDLEKYKEGDYLQDKRKKEAAVAIAREELKRARDRLEWTRKLAAKDYVTQDDLEADEFAVRKREIDLESAIEDLHLLEEYTRRRQEQMLGILVVESEGDLERIQLTGQRDVASREAAVEAAVATVELEEIKLKDLEKQVAGATIYAPQDGMVVYEKERWGRGDPLQVGTAVNPRQKLIQLPDFSAWKVEARIHESMIQQIKPGLTAFITLDAFPEQTLEGQVAKVSVLPDNSNWYRDVQEYIVDVNMDAKRPNFKPGMSAKAEIVLGELRNVIVVPIQAVNSRNGQAVVWLEGEAGPTLVEVTPGAHNERFVEIVSGLSEGQIVYLDQSVGKGSALGPRPSQGASEEQRVSAGRNADGVEINAAESEAEERKRGGGRKAEKEAGEERPRKTRPEGEREGEGAARQIDPANLSDEQREEMKKKMSEYLESLPEDQREAAAGKIRERMGGGASGNAGSAERNTGGGSDSSR